MNKIAFIFLSFLFSGIWLFSQSGAYTNYENENMALFRTVYDFSYPTFPERDSASVSSSAFWTPSDSAINTEKGTVMYQMDPGINQLIYIDTTYKPPTDGYRIQLFAGSDLGTANKIKSDFTFLYDQEAYLDWEQPTFRVRVGNFLVKSDAVVFCNKLKRNFPGAFVVKDQVKKPELRRNRLESSLFIQTDSVETDTILPPSTINKEF